MPGWIAFNIESVVTAGANSATRVANVALIRPWMDGDALRTKFSQSKAVCKLGTSPPRAFRNGYFVDVNTEFVSSFMGTKLKKRPCLLKNEETVCTSRTLCASQPRNEHIELIKWMK